MPGSATLFIADVHLGYAWAMRRRRQLGPLTEGGVRDKLREAVTEFSPSTIVLLGDVVHAPRPGHMERKNVESALRQLTGLAKVFVVRGNHDRAFARDYAALGMEMMEKWEDPYVIAVHGDRRSEGCEKHVLMGHIHPAIGVMDHAGATQRVPVFLVSQRVTVLPAFSPFAAGVDVLDRMPAALSETFGSDDVLVVAASGKRAVRIGPLSRLSSRA
jgi:hypothetical protein